MLCPLKFALPTSWSTAPTRGSSAPFTRAFSAGSGGRCSVTPTLTSAAGVTLLFVQEEDYVSPVWPEEEGRQQKQVHFDFLVPDVAEAVAKAEALGGRKADAQFGGEVFTTVLDPAGHPLCLVKEG
ncbi:VOC family protein [Oscillospiraceae bacterium 52-8]